MKIQQQQVNAIARLPEALRAPAYALLNRDASGRAVVLNHYHGGPTPEEVLRNRQQQDQALRMLDQMPPDDRLKILTVFFPKFAPSVEAAWLFQQRMPYQDGYAKKAFRAPSQPGYTFWKRIYWLKQLIGQLRVFPDADLIWLAQHAGYFRDYSQSALLLGVVFAAVIDSDDPLADALFDILTASLRGDHAVGIMGKHIPVALLSASRPDGWEAVERLLLAAQREEGLRQSILEAVDLAHPQAFQRLLRLIVEHGLARFSAVTRALNVWIGYNWDSENTRLIHDTLTRLLTLLESAEQRQQALATGTGEAVYLALWTAAFDDAEAAIPLATGLLHDADAERRFAALHLLAQLDLPKADAAMLPALADDDLRLALYTAYAYRNGQAARQPVDIFEQVEALLARVPDKAKTYPPLIWPWQVITANREVVASLLISGLGDRSPRLLIPYMSVFDVRDRVWATRKLAQQLGMEDPEARDAVLKLTADRSRWVREQALKLIEEQPLREQDTLFLEGLLTRKSSDTRRGVLRMLAKQSDDSALASADRLTAAKDPLQRAAGLELLHMLAEAGRSVPAARRRAEAYRGAAQAASLTISEADDAMLRRILAEEQAEVTLDNALGLMNPAERTRPTTPQPRRITEMTQAAARCLEALDTLIHERRDTLITLKTWEGEQEHLLGNAGHNFPNAPYEPSVDPDRLPLREVWEGWYANRPAAQRDRDGLELIRAKLDSRDGQRASFALLGPRRVRLQYPQLVTKVINWLLRLHEPPGMTDFLLDVLENSFAEFARRPQQEQAEKLRDEHSDWRVGWHRSPQIYWLELVRSQRVSSPDWTPAHDVRLFRLLRWMDEPVAGVRRVRPTLEEVLRAWSAGAATEADVYDQLLGPRQRQGYGGQFDDLRWLSSKRPSDLFTRYPDLRPVFEACRQRVLEVEIERGELPTVASDAALALRSVYGLGWFVRMMQRLGKGNLARGYAYHSQSRPTVLSHLLRVSFPAEGETAEDFTAAVQKARLSETQLVEAALYAPQWANYVESALGWAGFTDAVWWIHAHTKDNNWYVDTEIRETWTAQVSERTPLTGHDLLAGAVDVAWFQRVYTALGAQRWATLYQAAKYSSGGQGHNRARLFADAMLGRADRAEVVKRITDKRHQDSVRALGLLPLPADARDAEMLARYQVIQGFVRGARKFGAQRQESEKLAARIALENLARTAGYPDPLRLQWAMEAEEVADLRGGTVSATVEDVTVTLSVDVRGKPQLDIHRGSKRLKAIPAKVRKAEAIAELTDRKKRLETQYARMRRALEEAMCREDRFTSAELRALTQHPILAPLLEQLIFMTDDGLMGYPVDGGAALQGHDGGLMALEADAELRIAHPCDLYRSGEWSAWQRECFLAERLQPFKQVFRELYVQTATEVGIGQDSKLSRRYAGHQVQPRQAIALLGARGWVSRPDEGISRTFHKQRMSAFITFMHGVYTPAEVEGLTVESVGFIEVGPRWQVIPLNEVPPVIFSEVMRDLDLMVSVAHRGGIDPEASASTVEMRAALIRETCALLKVTNVQLRGSHALIEGKLGSYSLHLGSGLVHRMPGGALCIIPVHAQHRGRIFLPFADDDPRTAEVMSKLLLLARDEQIKDPTILAQLYSVGG